MHFFGKLWVARLWLHGVHSTHIHTHRHSLLMCIKCLSTSLQVLKVIYIVFQRFLFSHFCSLRTNVADDCMRFNLTVDETNRTYQSKRHRWAEDKKKKMYEEKLCTKTWKVCVHLFLACTFLLLLLLRYYDGEVLVVSLFPVLFYLSRGHERASQTAIWDESIYYYIFVFLFQWN